MNFESGLQGFMFNGSVGFQNLNWFLNSGFRVQGLGNGFEGLWFWEWVEGSRVLGRVENLGF